MPSSEFSLQCSAPVGCLYTFTWIWCSNTNTHALWGCIRHGECCECRYSQWIVYLQGQTESCQEELQYRSRCVLQSVHRQSNKKGHLSGSNIAFVSTFPGVSLQSLCRSVSSILYLLQVFHTLSERLRLQPAAATCQHWLGNHTCRMFCMPFNVFDAQLVHHGANPTVTDRNASHAGCSCQQHLVTWTSLGSLWVCHDVPGDSTDGLSVHSKVRCPGLSTVGNRRCHTYATGVWLVQYRIQIALYAWETFE